MIVAVLALDSVGLLGLWVSRGLVQATAAAGGQAVAGSSFLLVLGVGLLSHAAAAFRAKRTSSWLPFLGACAVFLVSVGWLAFMVWGFAVSVRVGVY